VLSTQGKPSQQRYCEPHGGFVLAAWTDAHGTDGTSSGSLCPAVPQEDDGL
jgi:hypothetical protein